MFTPTQPIKKPDFRPQPQNQPKPQQGGDRRENTGDSKRRTKWNGLLRLLAIAGSLLGMYLSAQFSVDGFRFTVDDRAWIGWAMAGILIVIQFIWQRFGGNLTLLVLALVCYLYGITTNVVGMIHNRGGYDGNPMSLVVPVVFGLMLELFPEPVLQWAISGDTSSDPLGKFLDRVDEDTANTVRKYSYHD
jgi:hypothetical protein